MRLLRSYRMRRRLLLFGVPTLLAVGVVAFSLRVGNTAPNNANFAPRQNEPAMVVREPKRVRATKAERSAAYETAIRFINTAVKRKDVAASWHLVTPTMRQGYTRRAWSRGDIPVVPYPARQPRLAPYRLDYQYKDALGFVFLLLPEEKRRDVAPMTFFLDVKATGKGKAREWRVDYFLPAGTSVAPNPQQGEESSFPNLGQAAERARATGESELGREWLVVPIVILALAFVVPMAFVARGWYAGWRAERAYRRGL